MPLFFRCRDLTSWISGIMALVTSDELAKDVASAEALLDRHQEHRAEIDARDSTFVAFEEFGKELLEKEHYASPDIQDKLDHLAQNRQELEKYIVALALTQLGNNVSATTASFIQH